MIRPIPMKPLKTIIFSFLFLCLSSPHLSHAYDDYSLEEIGIAYGHGIDVDPWVQIDVIQHVTPSLNIFTTYLKEPFLNIGLSTSKWKTSGHRAYSISANLMVRSQSIYSPIGQVFAEAGFGPHLISNPAGTRRLATAFEFNSFAGIGVYLSPQWVLIFRARHLSNAGITATNPGTNIYALQLNYHFSTVNNQ